MCKVRDLTHRPAPPHLGLLSAEIVLSSPANVFVVFFATVSTHLCLNLCACKGCPEHCWTNSCLRILGQIWKHIVKIGFVFRTAKREKTELCTSATSTKTKIQYIFFPVLGVIFLGISYLHPVFHGLVAKGCDTKSVKPYKPNTRCTVNPFHNIV